MEILKQIVFFSYLLFILNGCKKGEDDPPISFRTRTARVEGQWRLQKGNLIISMVNYISGDSYNQVISLSDSQFIDTETGQNNIPEVYRGAYVLNLNLKNDGSVTAFELFGGSLFTSNGKWRFNLKNGKQKSKEYLLFSIEDNRKFPTDFLLFNQTNSDFELISRGMSAQKNTINYIYRIKELRNKKMVLTIQASSYSDENLGIKRVYSGDFTFIQD